MKRIWVVALLLTLLTGGHALAVNELNIPAGVTSIQEEAFMGVGMIDEAILPYGLEKIKDRAFKDMGWLQSIYIPETVTSFGADMLEGTMDAVKIVCEPGSPAMRYATFNRKDYDAHTTCRALLIGNEYPGTEAELTGPHSDVYGLGELLNKLGDRPYDVCIGCDFNYDDLDDCIDDVFSEAQDQDISLFFFSGHGSEGGMLVMNDFEEYPAARLRQKLDGIPGRKIVIVDACYSGGLIEDDDTLLMAAGEAQGPDEAPQDWIGDFQRDFLAAFRRDRSSKAAFNPSEYFVLTSSRYDQESLNVAPDQEDDEEVLCCGLFTYYLCKGCGFDMVSGQWGAMYADADGDCAVSLEEACLSLDQDIIGFFEEIEEDPETRQLVRVYPSGCRWFAPFRDAYWAS